MTDSDTIEAGPEPAAPSWQPLAEFFNSTDPFFEKILFLRGYEFSSNAYAISGNDLTIVDPGNDYTGPMQLWERGFKPEDVKRVIVTHGHEDHAMGLVELLRGYPTIRERGGFELILHAAGPRQIKEFAKQCGCRVTEVEGGELLDLGGSSWQVINTPGHTVDGICLYHAGSKTLVTGDLVLPNAMAEVDQNAGGRLDHYLFSLRALLSRDTENVLPGHGPPVAGVGRQVIEDTYEGLMLKVIGVDGETSWMTGATALAQKGLLPEALFCCDKELLVHPAEGKALELKALCLNDLGRFNEALETLDRLVDLYPEAGNAFFTLLAKGFALMGLGKYQASVQQLDEALELQPGAQDALMYKGMALYLAGKYDEAMEIPQFRAEFVARFKDQMLKTATPEPDQTDGTAVYQGG